METVIEGVQMKLKSDFFPELSWKLSWNLWPFQKHQHNNEFLKRDGVGIFLICKAKHY